MLSRHYLKFSLNLPGNINICNTDCFFISNMLEIIYLMFVTMHGCSTYRFRQRVQVGGEQVVILPIFAREGHGGTQCLTGSKDGCHSSLPRPV